MKVIKADIIRFLILFTLIFNSLISKAIEPTWNVDMGAIFDNREGDEKHTRAETHFFVSLAPEVGLKFTSTDRIAAGAVWIQPLENSIRNGTLYPTVYYRHTGEKWNFSMGLFPMDQLKEPLPGFLWCDSLTYYQKNIRGALVQYKIPSAYFEAYIDWRGMESRTQREAFNIVFHGEKRPGCRRFLFGGYAMMNHLAKTLGENQGQFVVDNFLLNPYIGIDLSKKTVLDSIMIKGGALLTVERDRKIGKWNVPAGFWLDLTAEWKFLGARNSLYAGGKLFPLYGEYGSLLYQGEPYYASSFYDRLDVYAKIYRNKYVDLEAQLNFNFTSQGFMFYQRLLLNINVGNLTSR